MTDTVLRVVDAASFGLVCAENERLKRELAIKTEELDNLRAILAEKDEDFSAPSFNDISEFEEGVFQ